jgi:hypothetical protein
MSDHDYKIENLHNKYIISKTDGTPMDDEAEYFVLRLDTDPIARKAIWVYSLLLGIENPTFADELRKWIKTIEKKLDPI